MILITVHNENTYEIIFEKATLLFIDEYSNARKKNYSHEKAFDMAKLSVMDYLFLLMYKRPKLKEIVHAVYKSMQDDCYLYKKVILLFSPA